MSPPLISLADALRNSEVFVDGDWVESKDQDPDGDVRLIQLADVGDGTYVNKSSRFLTSAKARELNCTFLRRGDLLVARMPNPIGRACIFPGDARPAVTVVDVCIIRPNGSLDPRWLMHTINSRTCREQINYFASGTTRSRIARSNLKKLTIPHLSLREQQRIAEILDLAEALRAKRRAALAQVDRLAQSLFIDLFGDPAKNQKGWSRVKVGDVVFSASDGPHVSPTYSRDGVPFLSTRNVRAGEILWEDLKFISREDAELHWRKCKPEVGDILYTKGGTTGLAVAVTTPKPFALWVHVALLKPDQSKVDPIWLEAMLNTQFCYHQSQVLTHGIANRDLGLTRMVRIKMFLPPLDLQRNFVRCVSLLNSIRAREKSSLNELNALFASLQRHAFRGDL